MDDWHGVFDQLAEIVDGQNRAIAQLRGQLQATAIALSALARTHPDPEAFAEAFRRAWLAGDGFPQADTSAGDNRSGMQLVLAVLESSSRVPLNVRPPQKPPAT